ncbi:MAG: transcriptional repressor NrdR [Proteobacteria bacterium]|nr:transcriptional repressor NrdR [Pseudomonadota bacterium]
MRCPFCQNEDTQVKDSRPTESGDAIRRRRQCDKCESRFTTFERVQLRELTVLKRSGRRVPFDREKLERSVSVALRKRPIHDDQVQQMISGIVRKLESSGESESSPTRHIEAGDFARRAHCDRLGRKPLDHGGGSAC